MILYMLEVQILMFSSLRGGGHSYWIICKELAEDKEIKLAAALTEHQPAKTLEP